MSGPEIDLSGTSTSPKGFLAGATYAGIKTYGDGKLDLAILASDRPCAVAGTFTKARLHSASVDINREKIRDRRAQAVVVNSGCANSSTGQRGLDDGLQVTRWAGSQVSIPTDDVLICSTGVIGHFLPMEKIEKSLPAITLSAEGGADFARAIITTDTRPKHGAIRVGPYTVGGCAKGAGMIYPNMATMLAFLTTDAPVDPAFLQRVLSGAVERSFNRVAIDTDTSPSDTALLFANGAAGGSIIDAHAPLAGEFSAAVEGLCIHLAKEMARDGEGATKLIEFRVKGAAKEADAAELVRLLSISYLLKSAVNGADPNWGRIVSCIGRCDIPYDEADVRVSLCGHEVFANRRPTGADPAMVSKAMQGDTVVVDITLGGGPGEATGWGCDLSREYVTINADYHT